MKKPLSLLILLLLAALCGCKNEKELLDGNSTAALVAVPAAA